MPNLQSFRMFIYHSVFLLSCFLGIIRLGFSLIRKIGNQLTRLKQTRSWSLRICWGLIFLVGDRFFCDELTNHLRKEISSFDATEQVLSGAHIIPVRTALH